MNQKTAMFFDQVPPAESIVGHMSPEMTKMYMDHADDEARQLLKAMPVYLPARRPRPCRRPVTPGPCWPR